MRPEPPSRRDEFKVGIICALPLEYNAACLMFDSFWDEDGDRYGKSTGDPNSYTTGCVGNHNVVLALLPQMGKASAASAAASMRCSYTELQLVLLVGVCGATPQNQKQQGEILLGDVIISKAVIQYDFGRRYPDTFVRKDNVLDNLSRPHKGIRNLLAMLETDRVQALMERQTEKFLIALQQRVSATKHRGKYNYPGLLNDRLFQSTYRHKHHESPACICHSCHGYFDPVCDKAIQQTCVDLGCDQAYVVPRERIQAKEQRRREDHHVDQQPIIHVGIFASGDTVLKSGIHRDRVSEDTGVIAFEMEGAGVWEEVPCLIVKGVCDYADCHKNKEWQNFAAATAVSASKAILQRFIPTEQAPELTISGFSHNRLSTNADGKTEIYHSENNRNQSFQNARNFQSSNSIAVIAIVDQHMQDLEAILQTNDPDIPQELRILATDISQLGLRSLEKPALLQNMCDIASCSNIELHPSRKLARGSRLISTCRCHRRQNRQITSERSFRLGIAQLYYREEGIQLHSPTCPFHLRTAKSTSIGTKLGLTVGRAINVFLEASLTYGAGGAGGLSISPRLNVQAMIPNSPAIQLFADLKKSLGDPYLESATDACKLLEATQRNLFRLYNNREASPCEVNKDGETHLHILLEAIGYMPRFCVGDYAVMAQFSQMIVRLSAAGVPCNVRSFFNRGLVDQLNNALARLFGSDYFDMIGAVAASLNFRSSILVDLYNVSSISPSSFNGPPLLGLQPMIESGSIDITHDTTESPLVEAIISKSTEQLLSILTKEPKAIKQRTGDMTVLHLAANWPVGLSLLLSHGAEEFINDTTGAPGANITPIALACLFDCPDSVRILIDADCAITTDGTPGEFQGSLILCTVRCAKEVAKGFSNRRRRLFELAQDVLTANQMGTFQCTAVTVTDCEAKQIAKAIEQTGYKIPVPLRISKTADSIYNMYMPKVLFPIFFEHGFVGLHTRNWMGLMPIMMFATGEHLKITYDWDPTNCLTSIMPWIMEQCLLQESPADPVHLGINTTSTGWHYLAAELGRSHYYDMPVSRAMRESAGQHIQSFAEEVFDSRAVDGCQCWCSHNGCTPFTVYCKEESQHQIKLYTRPVILKNIFKKGGAQRSNLDKQARDELARAMLRILTFEALEITHTCCNYLEEDAMHGSDKGTFLIIKNFEGNVEEIQDEEKELLSRLTALLDESWSVYCGSTDSFEYFVRKYWIGRMRKECIPSEEAGTQIAAAGVKVDDKYVIPKRLENLLEAITLAPVDSWVSHLKQPHPVDGGTNQDDGSAIIQS